MKGLFVAKPKGKEKYNNRQERARDLNRKLEEEIAEKKEVEKKLCECYEYLGIVNRQLAIVMNLGKDCNGKKGKKIIDFVLRSAQSLSGADSVVFYRCNELNGKLHLISSVGVDESLILKKFSVTDCRSLETLWQEKIRMHGKVENRELEKFGLDATKEKYFLALPILENEKIIGVLFLGFKNKDNLTAQELDFYGLFSIQASFLITASKN
jgi:DNA-binding cell septation regulator SpoVG